MCNDEVDEVDASRRDDLKFKFEVGGFKKPVIG